jgi:protein transport protein SEC24
MDPDVGDVVSPPPEKSLDGESQPVVAEAMRDFVKLPPTAHPSITCISASSISLIDDGFSMYLYVGRNVAGDVLQDMFGVNGMDGVDTSRVLLQQGSERGRLLLTIVEEMQRDRTVRGDLKFVFAGSPGTSALEAEVMSLLVDDNTAHEVSYVDFLCAVHRKVQAKVVKDA